MNWGRPLEWVQALIQSCVNNFSKLFISHPASYDGYQVNLSKKSTALIMVLLCLEVLVIQGKGNVLTISNVLSGGRISTGGILCHPLSSFCP